MRIRSPFCPKMKIYSNLIGGRWIPSHSGRTMSDLNPGDTRDQIAVVQRSSAADVRKAVRAAKDALPAWSALPAPKRGQILFRSAALLESRKEALAALMRREMGKSIDEARGDVQEAIDTAYFYAGEGRRLYGRTTPSELTNKLCMTIRRPVGVTALITPWNFPLAIPAWKIYPSLICGNTAVLKPAEDTPLMALVFAELLAEAGLPPGVVNVVTGLGPEAGDALVRHPDIALVSFTGSASTGARIAALCGGQLKKCSLELGGKNALIVLDDADIDLAVDGALWGAFATTGQRCTASSRILLHHKIHDEFIKKFIKKCRSLTMGPLINRSQFEKTRRYVAIGKREGARLVMGGQRDFAPNKKNGYFFEPTVFTGVRPGMRIAREEIFGPVVSIIKVKSYDDAIQIANDSSYGLSSAVYTRDIQRATRALHALETGITYINSPTIGAEAHLPFGGVKRTGNGHREAGEAALDIFSEWKTIYMDTSGRLQKAQIDPS